MKRNINLVVPGLDANTSKAETLTITKGTSDSKQIILNQTGTTVVPTANINGNTYTYDEYTITSTLNNGTVSMKLNGTCNINGNVLTESGTVLYHCRSGIPRYLLKCAQ